MANNDSANRSIRYRRIRVPRQHQTTLHQPPLSDSLGLLQRNRSVISQQVEQRLNVSFFQNATDFDQLGSLRRLARTELVQSAVEYSSRYVEPTTTPTAVDVPIIMSGHQPELFHPGVWYKNFVLSELGQRTGGVSVNMVVDSDLAVANSVRFPDLNNQPVRTVAVAYDQPSATIPHELRKIQDREFFAGFADRVCRNFRPANNDPLVQQLWPHVLSAAQSLSSATSSSPPDAMLGAAIAAGRHRLEQSIGLKTLEVPLSILAQGRAFAAFVATVFDQAKKFSEIYNSVADQYRAVHRIRSQSHPVPPLTLVDDWTEAPFWIYTMDDPVRRGLFVKATKDTIFLSDQKQTQQSINKSNFVDEFCRLTRRGIFVRPRALTTTMFCRLLFSDIFIHGIGGAKYDQLTDAICQTFYGIQLPEYLTMSATMLLLPDEPVVSKSTLGEFKSHRRELEFHPERFLATDAVSADVAELIDQKKYWTAPERQSIRSRKKHEAIRQANLQLQQCLPSTPDSLSTTEDRLKRQLQRTQITGVREYSFCLFQEQLTTDLKDRVQHNFDPPIHQST